MHEQPPRRYAIRPSKKNRFPMPPGSLIPDRQLTFSPGLAATIGLEEAILLQGLGNVLADKEVLAQRVLLSDLQRMFPFWQPTKIQQLLLRLADLGIIGIQETGDSNTLNITTTGTHPPPAPPSRLGAQPVPQQWQPPEAVLQLLQLNHGIDRQFALAELQQFTATGTGPETDNRYRQHVLSAWRRSQQQHAAFEIKTPPPFDQHWAPSQDALDIMAAGGVDTEFIDSVRPEFILYWRERGGPPREVNSKFIGWVRQRWVRFQAGLGHSAEPQPMAADWQPSEQVYEVLSLSGIDRNYAQERLGEFRVFWCDSGDVQTSWNSKFLQHVKHQWRWEQGQSTRQDTHHGREQGRGQPGGESRTRDRSLADDLSDTSWAN